MLKWMPFLLGFTLLLTENCKDKPESPDHCDKKLMLQHYADQLIIPAYQHLEEALGTLQNHWTDFQAQPDLARIAGLQQQWLEVYQIWQTTNAFNFGPAGELGLKLALNKEIGVFPPDVIKINSRIASADFSTDNTFRNTRGFLALEYLLFDHPELLVSDANRRAYGNAVLVHLTGQVAAVNQDWATFRDQFVADLSSSAGGSMSVLYNEFLRSFEDLKNMKVGKPMGINTFFMVPSPELVEGYYSGQSLLLIKKHLQALENIYEGRAFDGTDGPGIKDYLSCVEGGPALADGIAVSLQQIHAALDAVPENPAFSVLVGQSDPAVNQLYNALKSHVHYFGNDLSSVLGLAITFDSADGD